MIILVDTDVLIDVALDRAPFAEDAAALLDALERDASKGFVAWHSISNFVYLVTRNIRDFRKSPIPALAPSQALARLA